MPSKTRASAPPEIATPEEILQTFTQIMRGEMTDMTCRKGSAGEEAVPMPPKISERQKAAEMLGKRYGLFTDREPAPKPKGPVIDEISAAMQELSRRHEC